MKFLAVLALVFSTNAFATGGFDCVGYDNGEKIELWGTTGRVPGNPLVTDVMMTRGAIEVAQVFKKDNIVGYWNMGKSFKLAIVDDNAEKFEILLKVKMKKDSPEGKGKLTLPNGNKIKVVCNQE